MIAAWTLQVSVTDVDPDRSSRRSDNPWIMTA